MGARLELIVPCHNEAARLKTETFLELARSGIGLSFIDDGSTDGTPAILAEVAQRSGGSVRVVTLKEHAGKAGAVHAGILSALEGKPDFVGFWDADLSTPLTALGDFMQVFQANPHIDVIIGARVKLLGRDIRRNPIRHYCGRLFATAASLALGLGVYDTQCGAKIFRTTDQVRQVFSEPFRARWVFDVEILARYLAAIGRPQADERIYELPLKNWTDVPGSKLTLLQAIGAFWDLAIIACRTPR